MNAVTNNTGTNGPLNQANAMANKFKPIDPIRVIREYLWLIIAVVLLSPVIGGGIWFTWNTISPRFTSMQRFDVMDNSGNAFDLESNELSKGNIQLIEAFIKNQTMMMKSEFVLKTALESPLVQKTDWYKSFNGDKSKMKKSLEKSVISAFSPRDSLLIILQASTKNKKDAPYILEAVRATYLQTLQIAARNSSSQLQDAFLAEKKRAEASINQLNIDIQKYASMNDVVVARQASADLKVQAYTEEKVALESSLAQTIEMYQMLVNKRQAGDYEPSPEDLQAVDQLPTILSMRQQVNALESELDATLKQWPDNHQTTKMMRFRYESAKSKLKREIDKEVRNLEESRISASQKAIDNIKGQIEQLQPKLEEANRELTDLSRNIENYNELIANRDAEKENKARAEESLSNLRVKSSRPDLLKVVPVGGSTEPEHASPKPLVVIPAITFFLIALTVGLIFLREVLDQHIKSPFDLKMIPGAELLSVIPDANEDKTNKAPIEGVAAAYPSGLIAESYRQARITTIRKIERSGYKIAYVRSYPTR